MTVEVTLEKVIDFALEVETRGHNLYLKLAEKFSGDAELHELFSTLAKDEEHHAQQFDALRDKAAASGPLTDEQQAYLRAVSISEIFSPENGIDQNLDGIESREDALERSFRLERASLFYYKAMKEVLESDMLDSMIAEEKSHLVQVMKYMVTGAKMRGLGDKF